jgi:cyclic dehypoxanthinyl futalosine synthase
MQRHRKEVGREDIMERISKDTAFDLYRNADLLDIGERADRIRKTLHPNPTVTFVVDRNINYTNVCVNRCRFCAFYRDPDSPEAYVLSNEDLFVKIEETIAQGGTQILLQGGLHPGLGLDYYCDLLRNVKNRFEISIHGFSPPEIWHLAERHDLSVRETLHLLRQAGLDSIPGGGAEILSDRVREILSPRKIRSDVWLRVMEEAHLLGMRTTATMMFGSVEEPEDIIGHFDELRALQDRTGGFTAFIPWSFQPGNTELSRATVADSPQQASGPMVTLATAVDYLRVLAISRIYLDNFANIQASWVTQGLKMAQIALRFGTNDFGSTMIEENVVRAAGVSYRVTKDDVIQAIRSAGFHPAQRDTHYRILRSF